MPERVTREERKISMAIQKARDAKEVLYCSLMDNNRSPKEDKSEHVKLKRPKAENYTYKGESNDGPTTLHAYAGEITKAITILKQIKESDYETNPFLDAEDRGAILEGINELDATITQLSKDYKSADKPEDMKAISDLMARLVKKVIYLEKVFRRMPEPRNEESGEALDPDYDKFMQR
tara:strand:+ start:288 stop:821 length:534 start_codon:yes stop_codon:yes gene_type:complete